MPLQIAFYDSMDGTVWYYIDLIIDFTFMFDVGVNCLSAYYDEDGKLVKKPKKLICSYLKGWMVIDIMASLPFNLIEKAFVPDASDTANYN